MMEQIAEAAPLFKARIAGFFWLMTFLRAYSPSLLAAGSLYPATPRPRRPTSWRTRRYFGRVPQLTLSRPSAMSLRRCSSMSCSSP